MPRAIAVNGASFFVEVRKFLEAKLGLAGVLEVPAGVFSPLSGMLSTVLVLGDLPIRAVKKVAFLALSNAGDLVQPETQPWFADFRRGLIGQAMNLGFTAVVGIEDTWTVAEHHPEGKVLDRRLRELTAVMEVGDACDIIVGARFRKEESVAGQGVQFVHGRDLGFQGLSKQSLRWFKRGAPIPEQMTLRVGDVLIPRTGPDFGSVVVGPQLAGVVASESIIILRPKDATVESTVISQFINSIAGQTLIAARQRGIGVPSITVSTLRTLPIPVLPHGISAELYRLQEIEQEVRTNADKLESMRLGMFTVEAMADLQRYLAPVRKFGRTLSAGIQQADSVEYQIRNFYPFPLTYAYRTTVSLTLPQDRYKEQLRVAENVLAFLGSLTLAIIAQEDHTASGLALRTYWQSGISPGHWLEICRRGSRTLQNYAGNNLSMSLASLWHEKGKDGFGSRMDRLIGLKNDFKHDRGPKVDEDYRETTAVVEELLVEVLARLAFLTEHPVRLVRDVDILRGTHRVILQTLRYEGDHPGLPQERIEYKEPLKKNDLYLQITSNNLIPLFPFVTAFNCPHCKTRETYFVDQWRGVGERAMLKSFERGHTEQSEEVGQGLADW